MKNILIIEDERFIGEMYVRSLEIAGHSVDWAIDGSDGLVMAKNKKYDTILADIMLPNIRGYEIFMQLRNSNELSSDAKMILMTNLQYSNKERDEIIKVSDDYFVKSDLLPRDIVNLV